MTRFESAQAAADWINGARWKGEKNGLENTRALLAALDHPENKMGRIIHVAGTNGKGSTCAMIDKALRNCGYKVGLFTSPYLCAFNERIRLNGAPIPDEDLIDIASRVREAAEGLISAGVYATTFEILTACACLYYAEKQADFSVMEVGMGGRLDSTNVLMPDVCAIAMIGMDHMSRLGNTLSEIAAEKAGIMKTGVPAVVLTQDENVMRVFRETARSMRTPLFETGIIHKLSQDRNGFEIAVELPTSGFTRVKGNLPGAHQEKNAAIAVNVLDRLGINMQKALSGIEKAVWPGRLEWVENILIDGAHNPQGAHALKSYLDAYVPERPIVLLTGMMQDKQVEACASIFKEFSDYVITTNVNWPRAVHAQELKNYYKNALAFDTVESALKHARGLAGKDGAVVCAGSIYLAGDVRNLLLPEDKGFL